MSEIRVLRPEPCSWRKGPLHRHSETVLSQVDCDGVLWRVEWRRGYDRTVAWVIRDGQPLWWSVVEVANWCWVRMPWEGIRKGAMSYLSRAQEAHAKKAEKLPAEEVRWLEKHPAIVEWCTATEFPDGRKRLPSTMTVCYQDGVWKACLNDKDAERGLWVSAGSVIALFDALEGCLQAGTGDWRSWAPYKRKGGKR